VVSIFDHVRGTLKKTRFQGFNLCIRLDMRKWGVLVVWG
jgi:hypothetical protein